MTFAEKLRYYRGQKKLTQNAVADLTGISRRMYLYYESGTKYPRKRGTVEKLAEVLGVELSRLLPEDDEDLKEQFTGLASEEQELFLEEASALFFENTEVPPELKQRLSDRVQQLYAHTLGEESLNRSEGLPEQLPSVMEK